MKKFFNRVKLNYDECIKDKKFFDTLPNDSTLTFEVLSDASNSIQEFRNSLDSLDEKLFDSAIRFYRQVGFFRGIDEFKNMENSGLASYLNIKEEHIDAFFKHLPYSHCNIALFSFFIQIIGYDGKPFDYLMEYLNHSQRVLEIEMDNEIDELVRLYGLSICASNNSISFGDLSRKKRFFKDLGRGVHLRKTTQLPFGATIPLVYNETKDTIELEINEKDLILSMLEVAPKIGKDYEEIFTTSTNLLRYLFMESIIEYPSASSYFK